MPPYRMLGVSRSYQFLVCSEQIANLLCLPLACFRLGTLAMFHMLLYFFLWVILSRVPRYRVFQILLGSL